MTKDLYCRALYLVEVFLHAADAEAGAEVSGVVAGEVLLEHFVVHGRGQSRLVPLG